MILITGFDLAPPNIIGSAYTPEDIIAKNLEQISDEIKRNLELENLAQTEILEVVYKTSEDGIGSVEGITRRRAQTQISDKVFRANLAILEIRLKRDRTKVIWREEKTNTQFTPTILNCFADESSSYDMVGICDFLNYHADILSQALVKVGGLNFSFCIWYGKDGKWLVRSLGLSGQNTKYHCSRCEISNEQGVDQSKLGEKRTPEKIRKLSKLGRWNPLKILKGNTLYDDTRGCKTDPINPCHPDRICIDELHMDLNLFLLFWKLLTIIFQTCRNTGENCDSDNKLKWRQSKQDNDFRNHENMFRQNFLRVS